MIPFVWTIFIKELERNEFNSTATYKTDALLYFHWTLELTIFWKSRHSLKFTEMNVVDVECLIVPDNSFVLHTVW